MTRTKLVFLLGAATLVAATGAGFADDLYLGDHAGISIPDIRGSQTDLFSKNFTSRRGPYFGLTAEIPLARRFSPGRRSQLHVPGRHPEGHTAHHDGHLGQGIGLTK